jgi:hypothetical protein
MNSPPYNIITTKIGEKFINIPVEIEKPEKVIISKEKDEFYTKIALTEAMEIAKVKDFTNSRNEILSLAMQYSYFAKMLEIFNYGVFIYAYLRFSKKRIPDKSVPFMQKLRPRSISFLYSIGIFFLCSIPMSYLLVSSQNIRTAYVKQLLSNDEEKLKEYEKFIQESPYSFIKI